MRVGYDGIVVDNENDYRCLKMMAGPLEIDEPESSMATKMASMATKMLKVVVIEDMTSKRDAGETTSLLKNKCYY